MSTSNIPTTMQALALPTTPGPPSSYLVSTLPMPTLTPTSILLRIHAASLNPGDIKQASSSIPFLTYPTFPYPLGHDLAGTVATIGSEVNTQFKVGDKVYAMLPMSDRGSVAEYALLRDPSRLARMPAGVSYAEAAALACCVVTGSQALDRAGPGELEGKTVFVPAGLGGTGCYGVQLAKHVYGASCVITTVSTAKLGRVSEFLGSGTVDQVVDYTKEDVVEAIGKGSVDFYYDTVGQAMSQIGLVKDGGKVVTVTAPPPGEELAKLMPDAPGLIKKGLDAVDWTNRWRAGRKGVGWEARATLVSGEDLEQVREWVESGKIRPVVGCVAKLTELEKIQEECMKLMQGKGGIGKFVIEID